MPKKNGFVLVIFHPDEGAEGAVTFASKARLKKYFLDEMVYDMANIDPEEMALYVKHVKGGRFWEAMAIYGLETEEEYGSRMELFETEILS